jgi:NADH:ubiquinone oxidoreductase subunit 5 (subunit L)/multisubunit Na+/H+ antiporter MnhA subunit
MKISAQFSMWGSVVFALFCLGYAFAGFSSMDAMADDATRADARGFALFWLFLGAIGIVMAIVSWRMVKGDDEGSAKR